MKTLCLALMLAAIGCQSCAHNPPTPPTPTDGAAPSGSCTTACANGARLGCMYATPTPQGHTCLEVCANAAQSVPWDVVGLTAATICTPGK